MWSDSQPTKPEAKIADNVPQDDSDTDPTALPKQVDNRQVMDVSDLRDVFQPPNHPKTKRELTLRWRFRLLS